MSRPEALQYREACLKYTVKKSERHLFMDVLREIGAEIEGFHSMLEASLIAGQLTDLRITEGDQYLLYLRNLPDKVAEFVQLHCGATTVDSPMTWTARCMWLQGQSRALRASLATIVANVDTWLVIAHSL